MKRQSTKGKKQQIKSKKFLVYFMIIAAALIAALWQFVFTNRNVSNDQAPTITFEKCVNKYGLDQSEPPKCKDPNGYTYMEFKTKGTTFEECEKEGGTIKWGGCLTKEGRRFIQKLPEKVSTYNECREGYSEYRDSTPEPYICVDKNGLAFYAGGEGRVVNSFEECRNARGAIGKNGRPLKCYFGTVVYWQTPKPTLKYLNVPYELKTFEDCVTPGFAVKVEVEGDRISCKAFNNKKYYYDGPKIDSFEDCARVMGFVLESNPPQCYGPDGTHYIGPKG